MPKTKRNRRTPKIDLLVQSPGMEPVSARVPLDVCPHDLILAGRGRFLPSGVLPSRLMRGKTQVAHYDPLAPLSEGGTQDGDILFCELDTGQSLDAPSFLMAYRAMSEYALNARNLGQQAGHSPVVTEEG